MPLVSLSHFNTAIRRAWRAAGRIPTWPATPPPSAVFPRGLRDKTVDLLRPVMHLLGVESDTSLASRIGLQRSRLSCIRAELQIPPAPRIIITSDHRNEIIRRLRAGEPIKVIAASAGLSTTPIRKLARSIGWHASWTKCVYSRSSTVGSMQRVVVEAKLRHGATLSDLARQAGVSHQRIAQVAKAAGIPSRKDLLKPQREAKRREKQRAKEQARRDRARIRAARPARNRTKWRRFLTRARSLYRRGLAISAIARVYRMPTQSMAWWIYRGRRELGWFPRRGT